MTMPTFHLPEMAADFYTLPNGMELLVHEDASAPVVCVQAWVRTGSIHEGRWLGSGISHLLEHMLFKGTPKRGPQEFARAVQDHGGYINAYTSFDRTVYWVDVPAKGMEASLDLLADAVLNSILPEGEFVKEQEVIRREFAMGDDDPDNVAGRQLFSTAYAVHPMRYPVIGHLDIFNAITREDLHAYYRERYAPNNIFFVVVGDVKAEAVRRKLEECTSAVARRALPDVLVPLEPRQLGRRERFAEFDTELSRLHLAWHIPAITHRDLPALDLLATVLGGGRSARLYQRLREELGIVHSVDAWTYTPVSAGLFGMDAMLDPARLERVQAELLAVIEGIKHDAVHPAELDKARRQFLSHHIASLTSMRGKASDIGSNWLQTRSIRFAHDYLEAAQHVGPDDLARVARAYFHEANLTVSSLNPRGTAAACVSIQGIARPQPETEMTTLPNGLRLLVREDHRLPIVSIVATFRAGLLAENENSSGITRLLARTLLKGTTTRSAEDIAQTIESVGGSIGSDSGNNSISITARVLAPDVALGVELIADIIAHATFPERAIAREKEVQLASLKADDEDVTSIARNALRKRMFAGHPFALHPLGTPASIAAITRAQLAAFRDAHFCARNAVIAIYGAVPVDVARKLALRHFGSLQEGTLAFPSIIQPALPQVSDTLVEQRPKAQAVVMTAFPGVDFFSKDRVVLDLIEVACSDLGSRLFNRIREQMGLAYFVGSSHFTGLARGAFSFYLGTDPAKLDVVCAALCEEIEKLATDGLAVEELSRAKEKLIGAQVIRSQSNDAMAFTAALDELYGLGHCYHISLRERVEAVTPQRIRDVSARIFQRPSITAIVRP